MKFTMRLYLLMSFTSIIMLGCSTASNPGKDPFYEKGSELDYLRFPLIEPYYAVFSNDGYGWGIPLEGDPSSRTFYYYLQLHGVEKIAVEKGVIMAYTPYHELVDESIGEKTLNWFAFMPEQKIEMGFDNEIAFLAYVQQLGVQSPSWRKPDEILHEYDETGCLDWIPHCR